MKIAYVIDWDLNTNNGVLNKIFDKLRIWIKRDNEIRLYVVSYKSNKSIIPLDLLDMVFIFDRGECNYLIFASLKTFFGRNTAFKELRERIASWSPEVIYYRPAFVWYSSVYKMLQKFPTVLEANTNDIEEVKLRGKYISKKYFV